MSPEGAIPKPSIIFVAKVRHILNNQLNQLLKICLQHETELKQKMSVKFVLGKNTRYFILACFGGYLLNLSQKCVRSVFTYFTVFYLGFLFCFLAERNISIAADISLCSFTLWMGKRSNTINFQLSPATTGFG